MLISDHETWESEKGESRMIGLLLAIRVAVVFRCTSFFRLSVQELDYEAGIIVSSCS